MTTELTEITVVGGDKTGLIARVTSLLFERGINVEDLDQAVRDDIFRMTLHADTTEMVCKEETLLDDLHDLGDELGVDVQVRFPADRETQQIAVLATKESHCLERLFQAWASGDRVRLTFLLYAGRVTENPNLDAAYRTTHGWVDVPAREDGV